jgi:hypothetical protein
MQKLARFLLAISLTLQVVSCATGNPPANYYENDIHHGYPGPGTADPSAD